MDGLSIIAFLQSEHFPFLGINNTSTPMADMRCRTTFYTALGRLLLVDLGEDEEKFDQFMMPLTGERQRQMFCLQGIHFVLLLLELFWLYKSTFFNNSE